MLGGDWVCLPAVSRQCDLFTPCVFSAGPEVPAFLHLVHLSLQPQVVAWSLCLWGLSLVIGAVSRGRWLYCSSSMRWTMLAFVLSNAQGRPKH